jgi:exopolysaccharide biosynthesis protein
MRYVALALLAGAAVWQPVRPGVWKRESRMATTGALAPVRAVAVRIDPRLVTFSLGQAEHGRAWTIDSVGALDAVAFNAGQFQSSGSWGWVVRDGVEMQPPGSGSVAMAFVVDSSGVPALIEQSEVPARRGHIRLAFQSYPALLVGDGALPWELQESGRGVDLAHRDSRLALGIRSDGSVVVVLTRFTGLGPGPGEMLPWGPTVPEMAAYMRSLGCRRAMLLDGGVSGQLAVRSHDGTLRRWPNWREVPLGLVVKSLGGAPPVGVRTASASRAP